MALLNFSRSSSALLAPVAVAVAVVGGTAHTASAVERPSESSLVQVFPDGGNVSLRVVDSSGAEIQLGSIPWEAGASSGLPRSDVASDSGIAYVLWDGLVTRLDLVNETNLGELASNPSGITWFGITLDDSTGALYLAGWNSAESLIQLDQVDRETGAVTVLGLLPEYLTFPNLDEIAAADGTMYFMTDVSRIWTMDIDTRVLGDEIDFPLHDGQLDAATSLDVDAHGVLHVVWHYEPSAEGWAMNYDLADQSWGAPDEFDLANSLNGLRTVSFSWWASADDLAASNGQGNLADTGAESGGITVAAAFLLAVGGTLAVRRRARR